MKVSGTGGVSAVKAATTLAGFYGGEPKKPLKPYSIEHMEEMKKCFIKKGLI